MTPPLSGAAELAGSAESLHPTDVSARYAGGQAEVCVEEVPTVGEHVPGWYERAAKPLLDGALGFVLLLLLAPVMAACAVAVLMSLGGPVLLRQQRIGHLGETFTIYKFRTMRPSRRSRRLDYVGPERRRTHKHPNDPRLTGVGRFLRTWSLDELPQLINVVRGEMSLVGPRPEMVDIVERYEPWQHRRHDVKPGITGLWQVTARGDVPMHQLTVVDLEYLRRVSLWTDLRILLLTLPAAFGMRRGF